MLTEIVGEHWWRELSEFAHENFSIITAVYMRTAYMYTNLPPHEVKRMELPYARLFAATESSWLEKSGPSSDACPLL